MVYGYVDESCSCLERILDQPPHARMSVMLQGVAIWMHACIYIQCS